MLSLQQGISIFLKAAVRSAERYCAKQVL